jgi:multiple sugar transport system permease protein
MSFFHPRRCCVWGLICLAGIFFAHAAYGADPAGTKPVEITMMLSPNDTARPVWQQVCDEFNRSHPKIRLRILWSDLPPKINLLSVAGALPDLIPIVDFLLIQEHSKLLDLNDLMDEDPQTKAQFYPSLLAASTYQGGLKTIPIFYNVPFVYYRPDLFRKAGLPYPSENWTWDEYRRDAKALTQRNPDGSVEIYGTYVLANWWVEWLSLIREAGGDMLGPDGTLKINTPATAQAVQLMHDLIYVDQSAPKLTESPPNGFLSGKMAIYVGGHVLELDALRKNAKFEWDIAPLPAGPAGKATGELATVGIGISTQSKHPELASEFLRYIMRKDVALELCQGGLSPPVRRDIALETVLVGTPETRTIPPKHLRVLVDSLAFASGVPKLTIFPIVCQCIGDGIIHALNDPDAGPIARLPADLAAKCQVLMDLQKTPPRTSPLLFAGQVVILGAAAIWLFFRLKRMKMTPEEAAGQKFFFLFTSPCIVGLCLFVLWPLLLSYWWAQTDYNMMDAPRYVGLKQYQDLLFKDPDFWHSLELSLVYALFAVPLGLIVSLATALLLNQNLRHIGIFRVIYYLPSILPAAASGLMWYWLLDPRFGFVNRFLALFGIAGPGWLQDPHWALISLILISTWGFGGGMLIFLAGLKNIPESLYEAAEIDGAGTVSKFFHITLPSLSPVLFFNLTMGCIGALQVFDIAYIISIANRGNDDLGGPEKSTYFYVLNLYVKSFLNLNIGTGSAMAWLFLLVILVITLANFWARRSWFSHDEEPS